MNLHISLCSLALAVQVAYAVPSSDNSSHKDLKKSKPATTELGLTFKLFATAPQVRNGTALTVDDKGQVFVCETYRWTKGVEDNRRHQSWIMDDLAIKTLDERRAMLTKWSASLPPDYFTKEADRITRLADRDGDGVAEEEKEFAGGFRDMVDGPAIGVLQSLTDPHVVYATIAPKIWKLTDADGDGIAEKREVLFDGLGIRTSLSGHDLHGLTWGPDGMLYFSIGDRGFHVTTKEGQVLTDPDAGAAFRCWPDGSGLEVVYHGLRNPQELAFNEFGDLFTVDNNSDQGDGARICWLLEGGHSGWHVGHQSLTTHKASINDGGFNQKPHWLEESLWKPAHEGQPQWVLPPLRNFTDGPSGLVFTTGLSLPERYANSFFICDYDGAPNQCSLWNFKVTQNGAGYEVKDAHLFHTGVANSDVDFGPDGRMFLLDYGGGWDRSDAGSVYSISWAEGQAKAEVKDAAKLLAEGFGQRSEENLIKLLGHADQRVRLRASYALAAKGGKITPALTEAIKKTDGFARLHAIWTLGQIRDMKALNLLLTHADAEVRAQAAKTVGLISKLPYNGLYYPVQFVGQDRHYPHAVSDAALRLLLADAEPRVRSFAAIALGRISYGDNRSAIVEMIAKQGTQDAFLRHAGVMALAGCVHGKGLGELCNDQRPTVRLSAVLALRRQLDPGVAAYLYDKEKAVAEEAIRAIADGPIPEARPALRKLATEYAEGDSRSLLNNELHLRRVLRSLQAEGTAEAAATLAEIAASSQVPENHRLLALLTLNNFTNPPPIDPTNGLYRPLPPRDAAMVKTAVETELAPLLDDKSGDIQAAALTLHVGLGIAVKPERLAAWVADSKQPMALRVAAVEKLPAALAEPFTESNVAEVRGAAALVVAAAQPERTVALAESLLKRVTRADRQNAYALLGTAAGAPAAEALGRELQQLREGKIPVEVGLDLIEAATLRTEPALKEQLAAFEASLASGGKSLLNYALRGGDPAKGRDVFANQGLCLKCHSSDAAGGNAGPPLGDVAVRLKPEQILEAVVNPNASIVPGYGVVFLTMKDGTSLTGSPGAENATELTLRTAEGKEIKVAKADIKEQTPAISPMPAMGLVLPRRDLQNLMAYLSTLKKALPVVK